LGRAPAKAADVIVLFVRNRAELDLKLVATLGTLKAGAIFWLAYPKLTSPIAGDLNRDIIRSLERDDFSSNRDPALAYWWSMIFPENRYPLFGIML
jgi:hypothetical protein